MSKSGASFTKRIQSNVQLNFDGSNTDDSSTTAVLNSFLSP